MQFDGSRVGDPAADVDAYRETRGDGAGEWGSSGPAGTQLPAQRRKRRESRGGAVFQVGRVTRPRANEIINRSYALMGTGLFVEVTPPCKGLGDHSFRVLLNEAKLFALF